jgi:subfamily B ATP-binding cassette protein MsbA
VIGRIISFGQQILLAVVYLLIAFLFGPVLTLFAAVTLGLLTYIIRNVISPGGVLGERVANANQRIQQNTQAGTQGIRDVKLFGLNEELLSEFQLNLENYVSSNIKLQRNKELIGSAYEMVVALLLFFLIYLAIDILSISLATLGVLLFAMFRLAPRVSNLNSQFYSIEGDLPHLVRTHAFIDELAHNQERGSGDKSPPDVVETISFNDTSFSYNNAEEMVLDGITFEVDRGEFVAFVGQSGVGKSTLASLLTRMYDPDTGEISVNGTPIHEFDLREWRNKFGVVRQDPHIFNETLEFNLTIGKRDTTREEIAKAVNTAKVSEFLDDLPKGYDTELGEDGVQLSGGQRQRVALARALLTDADILVLDEATSDLDSNLEREIHSAIENLRSEYTLFVIAHRLSTVKNADRIYTLESGEITEVGTHDELMDNGGKYSELYATQ